MNYVLLNTTVSIYRWIKEVWKRLSRERQFNTIADAVADVITGSPDSMERGTVEWNTWNGGTSD